MSNEKVKPAYRNWKPKPYKPPLELRLAEARAAKWQPPLISINSKPKEKK